MKFKIPMEGGDDDINMAPMIDMVFLLLIFFMVASHLTSLERVPVKLPVADKATVPEEARDRQLVTLLARGEGANEAAIFMNLQEITLEEFAVAVREQYEADENVKIYLRADRAVKHRHVKAVMQACADAGVLDIIFGAFESGE